MPEMVVHNTSLYISDAGCNIAPEIALMVVAVMLAVMQP